MDTPFQTQRRVEFCETDAAGLAHFSAFFQYMEQAEHAMLRSLDLSVVQQDEGGQVISWPRVHADCDFQAAARFEDVLDIDVWIERLGSKSVSYCFVFRLGDTRIATGTIKTVCCRIEHGQPPRSINVPDWIRQRLQSYVRAVAR